MHRPSPCLTTFPYTWVFSQRLGLPHQQLRRRLRRNFNLQQPPPQISYYIGQGLAILQVAEASLTVRFTSPRLHAVATWVFQRALPRLSPPSRRDCACCGLPLSRINSTGRPLVAKHCIVPSGHAPVTAIQAALAIGFTQPASTWTASPGVWLTFPVAQRLIHRSGISRLLDCVLLLRNANQQTNILFWKPASP